MSSNRRAHPSGCPPRPGCPPSLTLRWHRFTWSLGLGSLWPRLRSSAYRGAVPSRPSATGSVTAAPPPAAAGPGRATLAGPIGDGPGTPPPPVDGMWLRCCRANSATDSLDWAASGGGRAQKPRWSGRSVAYPAAWQAARPRRRAVSETAAPKLLLQAALAGAAGRIVGDPCGAGPPRLTRQQVHHHRRAPVHHHRVADHGAGSHRHHPGHHLGGYRSAPPGAVS